MTAISSEINIKLKLKFPTCLPVQVFKSKEHGAHLGMRPRIKTLFQVNPWHKDNNLQAEDLDFVV